MDRRNFLKSIGALAAAATSMPSLASIITPNKYAESIRLLDECRGVTDTAEASRRVDILFAYLRENFAPPAKTEETLQGCRRLIQTRTYDADSEAVAGIRGIPPSVADDIYPIAIAKLGLTAYAIPLDSSRMKEFDWFHKTYGGIIINSMYKEPATEAEVQNKQTEAARAAIKRREDLQTELTNALSSK